jgi:hypothetical protein
MPKKRADAQDTDQDSPDYEANVNQVQHEPISVSRHDERQQDDVLRQQPEADSAARPAEPDGKK